jgi:hypothetical protein
VGGYGGRRGVEIREFREERARGKRERDGWSRSQGRARAGRPCLMREWMERPEPRKQEAAGGRLR